MIKITIYFKNDPSVGLQPETFTMEIPDFRKDWTESEEALNDYIEEKRKQIKELYTEFQGELVTRVLFQWEILDESKFDYNSELERDYDDEEHDQDEERRTLDELESNHEANIEDTLLSREEMRQLSDPSQVYVEGWVLCSDGLYRDLPY